MAEKSEIPTKARDGTSCLLNPPNDFAFKAIAIVTKIVVQRIVTIVYSGLELDPRAIKINEIPNAINTNLSYLNSQINLSGPSLLTLDLSSNTISFKTDLYEKMPILLVDDWNEITKEFLEENLTGLCDLEDVDFCRGFFMDLDQFQNCFKIKINKEEITKIVALSYSLFSSKTPHLYRINVNIITNC